LKGRAFEARRYEPQINSGDSRGSD
jgi:hypothetical protein